jgi:hypothetical protein
VIADDATMALDLAIAFIAVCLAILVGAFASTLTRELGFWGLLVMLGSTLALAYLFFHGPDLATGW